MPYQDQLRREFGVTNFVLDVIFGTWPTPYPAALRVACYPARGVRTHRSCCVRNENAPAEPGKMHARFPSVSRAGSVNVSLHREGGEGSGEMSAYKPSEHTYATGLKHIRKPDGKRQLSNAATEHLRRAAEQETEQMHLQLKLSIALLGHSLKHMPATPTKDKDHVRAAARTVAMHCREFEAKLSERQRQQQGPRPKSGGGGWQSPSAQSFSTIVRIESPRGSEPVLLSRPAARRSTAAAARPRPSSASNLLFGSHRLRTGSSPRELAVKALTPRATFVPSMLTSAQPEVNGHPPLLRPASASSSAMQLRSRSAMLSSPPREGGSSSDDEYDEQPSPPRSPSPYSPAHSAPRSPSRSSPHSRPQSASAVASTLAVSATPPLHAPSRRPSSAMPRPRSPQHSPRRSDAASPPRSPGRGGERPKKLTSSVVQYYMAGRPRQQVSLEEKELASDGF